MWLVAGRSIHYCHTIGVSSNVETQARYEAAGQTSYIAEHGLKILQIMGWVRNSRKFHFVDPSLAVAALGADPESLLADLNTTGLLFESMVIRDLRVYSQPLGGDVRHYRDNTGLEIDAVVTSPGNRWCACEVKLSSAAHIVDAAATQLLKFAQRVDTTRCGEPMALLAVSYTHLTLPTTPYV